MASVTYGATGVNFSDYQTPNAGQSSELLDHYEEGTYTPAFSMLTVDTIYLAGYTKIGNYVFCQCYCELSGGNSSPTVHTGAPFACRAAGYSPGSLDYAAANANLTNPHVRSGSNSSNVEFFKNQVASIAASEIDGGHVIWSVDYRTT